VGDFEMIAWVVCNKIIFRVLNLKKMVMPPSIRKLTKQSGASTRSKSSNTNYPQRTAKKAAKLLDYQNQKDVSN